LSPESQVHKITNVPVVLDLMILMRANPLHGQLEGVGPENLDFFGPKWHMLCLLRVHRFFNQFKKGL